MTIEACQATQVDHNGLVHDTVTFDAEDHDAAFAALNARWDASQT